MNMEHNERKQWCEEVSKINKKMNSNKTKSSLTLGFSIYQVILDVL